jgi:hypothetical protein
VYHSNRIAFGEKERSTHRCGANGGYEDAEHDEDNRRPDRGGRRIPGAADRTLAVVRKRNQAIDLDAPEVLALALGASRSDRVLTQR